MQIRIIAVGTRMPRWVDEACADYSGRFAPGEINIEWKEIRPEPRGTTGNKQSWLEREAVRIRQALPEQAWRVTLDEHGRDYDTAALARRLEFWRNLGRPLAVLIGGADGLAPDLKSNADEQIRLSSLTLPHALVRVLLAEQLFRAWSILNNHPYHRA
jgi:23S rRNA (pseudouridine1915-N3)-methyltransferase